jgi:hypothetical protein
MDGARIRIINITDPEDADLNGLEGVLSQKRRSRDPRFPHNWAFGSVGFVGKDKQGRPVQANLKYGEYERL